MQCVPVDMDYRNSIGIPSSGKKCYNHHIRVTEIGCLVSKHLEGKVNQEYEGEGRLGENIIGLGA